MFYIIGIGLADKQLTIEAIDAIKGCKNIFIDNYTNILSDGDLKNIEKIVSKNVISLNRTELEQEKKYLKEDSCLLVIGNPFSATTHYSIITELISNKIKYKIIPGISIFNYRGVCGLSEYKFGKTTSIVYPEKNYYPKSFYDVILDNLKIEAHTLCLLDIKIQENRFMSVKEACEILDDIDKDKILDDKKCVLLSKMGAENQKIISFNFKEYNKLNEYAKPQSLIICGKLSEIEKVSIDEYRL